MRAHDSTFQYISVRRETGRQCWSKQVYHRLGSFATCHRCHSIPLCYLSRARNVRAAQVVGAFFHEWIHAKQALGQSTNFLKLCMLKLLKLNLTKCTDAPNMCSIFPHCFQLAANAILKKTCITQQQTQFRRKRRGHCNNSIQNPKSTWTGDVQPASLPGPTVPSFPHIGSPPEAWKGLSWWLKQVKLPQLCKSHQRYNMIWSPASF